MRSIIEELYYGNISPSDRDIIRGGTYSHMLNLVTRNEDDLVQTLTQAQQQWNVYRGRAIGHWLQDNGVPIITNVRWSDDRTYELCCIGTPANSSIAIGSHGCIRLLRERKYFVQGLDYVVNRLKPKTIIVYGTAPDTIFSKYKKAGIAILQFDSDYMIAHKKAVNA